MRAWRSPWNRTRRRSGWWAKAFAGPAAPTLARVREALHGTDVRLTSHGSSSLSLGFVVRETDLRMAMEALHREFFANPDGRIFAVPDTTWPLHSGAPGRDLPRHPLGYGQAHAQAHAQAMERA